jgi:predicted RNA binding protein YcfA (HicA-like mRNA interferase family)
MKYPSLSYVEIINTLKRMGWIVVRQKGSHIRLHKGIHGQRLKLTVPAHKPVQPTTLKMILSQGKIELVDFLEHLG